VAAAAFAVFAGGLRGEFLTYDDLQKIRYNAQLHRLGAAELRWMWTTTYYGLYQPVAWLSWALDHALWGVEPFGYHLTSLLCHAATAVLVYRLASRLLEETRASDAARAPCTRSAAMVAALVFAVHPLRAEPVVWISARGDVLAGLFAAAATLAYVNAVGRGPRSGGWRRGWYAASVLLFTVGLLAKPSTLTLPLAWLVLDAYPLRRLGGQPAGAGARSRWTVLLEKVPHLAAASGIALLAIAAKTHTATMLPPSARPAVAAAGQALYSAAFYLRATLMPTGIAPLYERPPHLGTLAWPFAASAAAAAGITVALVALRRRAPGALAAWLAYLLLLAPVSGLVSYGSQLVAARYTYVTCLPWALLAGAAIPELVRRSGRRLAWTMVGVLLAGLAALSWWQARMWQDSATLWTYALEMAPESVAVRVRLGFLAERRGDFAAASAWYREALARWPGARLDDAGLGEMLEQEGHHVAAVRHYREALAREPDSRRLSLALGRALLLSGQAPEAVAHLDGVVARGPDFTDARLLYGIALLASGEVARAVRELERTLEREPTSALGHYHLAHALLHAGEPAAAAAHLREAVRLDPRLEGPARAAWSRLRGVDPPVPRPRRD
jgi:tetratricopeptide (TPR) repeat protein